MASARQSLNAIGDVSCEKRNSQPHSRNDPHRGTSPQLEKGAEPKRVEEVLSDILGRVPRIWL